MSNTTKDFISSIQTASKEKTSAYDSTATVKRIEGGTAWVHIPGGVDETPVKLTINAKAGDNVQVRVSGGNAFLVGNGSAPPTDDARANQAYTVATVAEGAAENALANAARAAEAADSAQASATRAESAAGDAVIAAGDAQTAAGNAQTAADTALVNLATTEDVVGVLNWITAHGTMTTQSGGVFVPGQVYFISDPAGDYVVGGNHYSVVPEPKADDIDSYYILTVNESVQNYVATHIVVDSEGLWIIPDAGGNKVLIATGSGSTYTTAGTYIVGNVGGVDTVLSSFTAGGITIGREYEFGANNESHLIINNNSMQLVDKTGEPYVYISEVDSEPFTSVSTFVSTTSQVFTVTYPINTVNSVKVDGVSVGYTITGSKTVTLTSAPLSPSRVEISYTTTSFGKRYTFGYRKGGTTIGDMSFAEGMNIEASGKYSHAEGNGSRATGAGSHAENDSIASGSYSHAEGSSTKSSGGNSHAEGINSESSGDYSHAQNYDTIAASDSQTALGKYNVEDNADTYAVIVGNGTADNARSNALTVDWSGNVEAAGDVKDGSANTLSSVASDVSTLKANKTGAYVNIASYTSSNKYTCPSDGYIFAYNAANNSSYITAEGSTDSGGTIAIGGQNQRHSLFVRKGMKVYVTGSFSAARFTPLS